ncbi:hybrid sensor histidine kinase/response regulator [Rhodopseudomonas palustris]|nr:PAS domain-containing sensor histidine kinase [Rhodopseudomonas palustris]
MSFDNASASLLRALVHAAPDGIFLVDRHQRIALFNPACEGLFGWSAREALGEDVATLIPDWRQQPALRSQVQARRRDGTTLTVTLATAASAADAASIVATVRERDITEQSRAERAIREADARVATLIQTVDNGVILTDRLGRIKTFNLACRRLFGYQADEVIDRHISMLAPAANADAIQSLLRRGNQADEHGRIGTVRGMTGLRRDGGTFPMELSAGTTVQDGEPVFVVAIQDLTDRKHTEERLAQAQKMEIVGQLSGGIAHDFNNLLTVIVGNAEFLADQLKARQDLRGLACEISRAGQRGAELTQRLLAFSRRQTLKPVAVDCNELVSSMHDLLRRTLREDIVIDIAFGAELCAAFADPAQLESAILNLSLNAQDAMLGGGRLSITTANVTLDASYQSLNQDVRPGDYVLIAITDNGSGMSKEVLDRVFEPFYTTKEVGKGSGLGLSMVYGFVKQSNGHVSLYSEPGLGTTVRLYLPAVAAGRPTGPERPDSVERLASRGEVVLIVEDDPFVRSYAVMCLRSLGYGVIAASDGAGALQTLDDDTHFDILFTDVVMPGGISGWELAETASRRRPDLRVLLTSGYALETIAGRSHGREHLAILTKPYRKADLARKLREVVESSPPAAICREC